MIAPVAMDHGLALAAVLFSVGLAGLLARRSLLLALMSIELMLASTGLAFVVAGARWGAADGQVMFLFVLAMAGAEVAVGLALALRLRETVGSADADRARRLRG